MFSIAVKFQRVRNKNDLGSEANRPYAGVEVVGLTGFEPATS